MRTLQEEELRAAYDLFLRAVLQRPSTDEQWSHLRARFETGRVLGAFVDDELAGTALTTSSAVVVPGGRKLPAGAVTGVAVRPDRTRRGILTGLMHAQLDDARQRNEPLAMLHASEAVIYERFGYGVATRARMVEINRIRTQFRDEVPRKGRVHLLELSAAARVLPEIYRDRVLARPGQIERTDGWWKSRLGMLSTGALVVVHQTDDGTYDGFAVYEPKSIEDAFDVAESQLQVHDLQAADSAVAASLWRFLLDIDLVNQVRVVDRPLDEPLELWLTDRRQCRTVATYDDLWLRLVDVETALQQRAFGSAEPVTIEVADSMLPTNSGCYRISGQGVERSTGQPQLSMDVATLASLYLGDHPVSRMVEAGRIQVHDAEAVPRAEELFRTGRLPWCGTNF
jgi:predicted acetyltransferase